jgi:hypothetical protein
MSKPLKPSFVKYDPPIKLSDAVTKYRAEYARACKGNDFAAQAVKKAKYDCLMQGIGMIQAALT